MNKKILIVNLAFLLGFSAVIVKAFKVQFLDREVLLKRHKSQVLRERKVYPKRGAIFDRNGHPLAINIETYSLFTIPKNLKKVLPEVDKLKKIIPELNVSRIKKTIKQRKKFTWISRKISLTKDQVDGIKKLKNIYFEVVPKRLYPNNEVASQVIGFVGVDNNGLSGIEHFYDTQLRGEPRVLKYIKDAKGRPVKFTSGDNGKVVQEIHLTIDKDIQAFSEKIIKEAVTKSKADSGGFGIMDPDTGEIIAMGNYPTFDPNNFRKYSEKLRKLPFVSDPFEPGSTFKTFTVSTVLRDGIAKPSTNYYCEKGEFKVGDHVIREAEQKKTYEWLSLEEILKYSSNIGTTKIAFELGYNHLKDGLLDLGIGEKTGIEISGESRGIFPEEDSISNLRLSNISFGQGVATTGIQMLRAYSVYANGGFLVTPTVVKTGKEREKNRIIEETVADEISRVLFEAVENGTGKNAKMKFFKIAGKTSTAQRVAKKGGYEGYVSGFIGYPLNTNKKYVTYIYIDNPKVKSYYGNSVAAPPFKKITEYLLYKKKDFNYAELEVPAKDTVNLDVVSKKNSSWRFGEKDQVPDFSGLDKISAQKIADKLNLKIKHLGIGVVENQKPAALTKIDLNKTIILKYKPPTL